MLLETARYTTPTGIPVVTDDNGLGSASDTTVTDPSADAL